MTYVQGRAAFDVSGIDGGARVEEQAHEVLVCRVERGRGQGGGG